MAAVGGSFKLSIAGTPRYAGEGEWTYNIGAMKRETAMSSVGPVGFTERHQVPFCEGELITNQELPDSEILNAVDVIVTLVLANEKTFTLSGAFQAGEGDYTTDGKLKVRFEGLKGELI